MAVKSVNYYLEKNSKREIDKQNIGISFDFEAKLKDVVTVQPAEQLATAEYYSKLPGVEIYQDVKQFWNLQQNKFNTIQTNIQNLKSSYLQGYGTMKDAEEALAKQEERMTGTNNPDKRIKELKAEKEKIKRNEIGQIFNRTKPGMAFLEFLTGFGNEEARKFKDPFQHLTSINKQIKAAEERRDEMLSAQNDLKATIEMGKMQMLKAIEEVDKQKCEASLANDNSLKIQKQLKEQYNIIDKYMAIQKFKGSNYYGSSMRILKVKEPQLAKDIENLPANIPQGLLKISLTNPLDLSRLPVSPEKIQEADEKINKVKGKLPVSIDMENISGEIEMYTLKPEELKRPGEAYANIEKELQAIDTMGYTPEEKAKKEQQLKMKLDHLKRQAVIINAQNDIKTTIEEINKLSPTDPNLKTKYDELEAKKGRLNLLQEDLKSDEYMKTINALNEATKLLNERANLQIPENVSKIEVISNGLSQQSQIPVNDKPLSVRFVEFIQDFSNQRNAWLNERFPKEQEEEMVLLPYGEFKTPNTQTMDNQDREDDEGR